MVEKVMVDSCSVVSGTWASDADFSTIGVEAVRRKTSGVKPCLSMR